MSMPHYSLGLIGLGLVLISVRLAFSFKGGRTIKGMVK